MENINVLLDVDFSAVSDEFNWLTNSSIPIQTVNGQLKLTPDASTSYFTRGLGALDPTNNRIRIQTNFDFYRPQTSPDESMTVLFGVYLGATKIDEFSVFMEEMSAGDRVEYNLDRLYYFEGLSGSVSLKITTPEGYQNEIYLDYLKAWDGRFLESEVRTYFIIDQFLEDAFASVASGIQLLEWKIDDVETLTSAFFTENPTPGGDPDVDWKYAKADIDGLNRDPDIVDYNTFNPFASEWGLIFENVAGNYWGGKPTGTVTSSDYGAGIMTIGLEKPGILNGDLDSKDGAFFIDIDYSKNLLVVFNVLVNNTNPDVFDSPASYKKFTIKWDAETCTSRFYYQDQLATDPSAIIPVDEDGFLSGITGQDTLTTAIACDEAFAYNGQSGTFEFVIDFGTDLGECGIDYNAFNLPDKFEIEWNGNVYSSGYVGLNTYDQQLLNLGISPSEINTDNPTTGDGLLKFMKNQATPTTAIVRVTAPLSGTAWNINGICPDGDLKIAPTVSMTTVKTIYQLEENITFNIVANDTDGTIDSWIVEYSDGTDDSGSGAPPATVVKAFEDLGAQSAKITVTDNDGLTASQTVYVDIYTNSSYQITGSTVANCTSGMAGTLTVTIGKLTVYNDFFVIQGSPNGADITIDGGALTPGTNKLLDVGVYPFSSPQVDCVSGSGVTKLLIF